MISSSHIHFQLMIPLTWESRVLISTGLCSVAQSWPTLCPALTVAHQTPLSMDSFRQEYWSGLPFPSTGDLPNPRNNLSFLHLLRCRQIRYHSATWEAKERRKSPSLWLFTNSYHSIVCRGREADCPSQSRAGSSRVYKKFSFTCYIKGDPRLHWGNESGSNEINSQAGTQAPSVGVWDQLIHKWGCVNFVCVCV